MSAPDSPDSPDLKVEERGRVLVLTMDLSLIHI